MIKSISAWAFAPDRPLDEIFQLAKQHGFEAVEVTLDVDGRLPPDASRQECERVRESAARHNVRIVSTASGLGWTFPMTSSNPQTRARAIELCGHALRATEVLGAGALLVVPGGVGADFLADFERTPYDVAYDNARAALGELEPVARETGVTLAIENVWNKFLLSPLELRDFIDGFNSPHVGSYFDVGNVLLTGYPEQWIRILGERIARVHFKDWKRSVGTAAGFCALGEGDVDYPAVMKALHEVGYNRSVTAEFFNCEDDLKTISEAMDRILAS